jgi:hypothetical protein
MVGDLLRGALEVANFDTFGALEALLFFRIK